MDNEYTEKYLKTLYKNIIQIQELTNIPDKEYSSILEISINTLKRIKRGEQPKNVTIITIINIYKHFGIYPSQLIGKTPLMFLNPQ
ncbi:MAG: hypothetical protein IJC50_03995 [Clostridia bacterium]|nr:hypothetical protein [Clostridia bacterium]